MKISPFAPDNFPHMPAIRGFDMATAEAGIRYQGRTDLWVLRGQPGTQVAGVFTRNAMPGAPVDWSRQALKSPMSADDPRLVVVNSGTANVFTGEVGRQAVVETAEAAAKCFGGVSEGVFLASTGVIGEALEASQVTAQFPTMKQEMLPDGWEAAARAIMTTDTYAKGATRQADIDGVPVTLNGIAKGSGMIAPDMATMLAFIATDAKLSQELLQQLLSEITNVTFNAITVDSDTSTSDTVLLLASGAAEHAPVSDISDPRLESFKTALQDIMQDLALQIVKDGEGASKFVTLTITGAVSDSSARKIGLSVANSPLVKTAIAGEDANWGRLIMAVGKAGEPADRDRLSIWMGPHLLAEKGGAATSYVEEQGATYMKRSELEIRIDIGLSDGRATVWTCDFTHAYIDINADYRS